MCVWRTIRNLFFGVYGLLWVTTGIPREPVSGGRLKIAGLETVERSKDWHKAAPHLDKTTLKRVVSEMNLYFFTSGLSHESSWSDKGKVWGHLVPEIAQRG